MESLICTLDIGVLKQNLIELRYPIFMVKADCYGHGIELATFADKYVTAFGVATESEGVRLRKKTRKPILVTAPNICNVRVYTQYALTPLVGSLEFARRLAYFDRRTRFHIKVDCGMGRFGFNTIEDLERFCDYAKIHYLSVTGIGSHIPSYECKNICKQRFREYIQASESRFGRLLRHIEASSTADDKDFDILRIGLKAYKNVMKLESHIAYIKKVNSGDGVGYNNIYIANNQELIAVVYGGYADGIPRSAVGYEVLINGYRAPIVAVCMDVFMVRLPFRCNVGDSVTIFSSFNDVEELSFVSNCIPYEIFTGIGRRCRFVYKE